MDPVAALVGGEGDSGVESIPLAGSEGSDPLLDDHLHPLPRCDRHLPTQPSQRVGAISFFGRHGPHLAYRRMGGRRGQV